MKFPVLVNVNIHTDDGIVVNRAVFDFHYKNIHTFANGATGNSIVTFVDGHTYDFQISFDDVYDLYNIQDNIHEQFKEEVDAFKKDNLRSMVEKIINPDEDADTELT